MPKLDNFTPRAEKLLALAADAMKEYGGVKISPQHVLEGFLRLGQGVSVQVLQKAIQKCGIEIREENIKQLRAFEKPSKNPSREIAYTKETENILLRAPKFAKDFNHTYTGTEHILLALLETKTPVTDLLDKFGISSHEMQNEIHRELDPNFPSEEASSAGAVSENPKAVGLSTIASEMDELGFQVLIDPGSASPEIIAEVFEAISELNRATGGEGMIFLDCPNEANVFSAAGV
jgi:ATP-dependent Clp protease ATP-binding subunit ClpC